MNVGQPTPDAEHYDRKEAIVAQRRVWIFATYPVVLASLAFFLTGLRLNFFVVLGLAAVLYHIPILLFLRWPKQQRVHLVANQTGIELDGRLAYAQGDLRNGFIRTLPTGRLVVRISGKMWSVPLDVDVANEVEGECLLRALRLDGTQATLSSHALAGGMKQSLIRLLIGIVFMAASIYAIVYYIVKNSAVSSPGVLWFGGFCLVSSIVFHVFARQEVELVIGADGVHIRRVLGGDDYIPYALVDGAHADGNDIVIQLHSGRSQRFGKGMKRILGAQHEAEGVANRIETMRSLRAHTHSTESKEL